MGHPDPAALALQPGQTLLPAFLLEEQTVLRPEVERDLGAPGRVLHDHLGNVGDVAPAQHEPRDVRHAAAHPVLGARAPARGDLHVAHGAQLFQHGVHVPVAIELVVVALRRAPRHVVEHHAGGHGARGRGHGDQPAAHAQPHPGDLLPGALGQPRGTQVQVRHALPRVRVDVLDLVQASGVTAVVTLDAQRGDTARGESACLHGPQSRGPVLGVRGRRCEHHRAGPGAVAAHGVGVGGRQVVRAQLQQVLLDLRAELRHMEARGRRGTPAAHVHPVLPVGRGGDGMVQSTHEGGDRLRARLRVDRGHAV